MIYFKSISFDTAIFKKPCLFTISIAESVGGCE